MSAGIHPIIELDRVTDEWLEHIRGHPVADKVFLTASELGDFSLI
ncbi:MAG: hypothetical protein JWM12_3085, partial [Ilumatobacteraceae bacterium]|nr:hypothetical protein [Ilumatobacteraceae bacterium]